MKVDRDLVYRSKQSAKNKIENTPDHSKGGFWSYATYEKKDIEKLARRLMGKK